MSAEAIEIGDERRSGIVMLAFSWMVLMALTDLYTTAAISALPIHRFYVLDIPDWLSRMVLWSSWSTLLFGILLLSLRLSGRLALTLCLFGFASAIALLGFDCYFPRRNGVDVVNSWQFPVGYFIAFFFAMICAVYVFRREVDSYVR